MKDPDINRQIADSPILKLLRSKNAALILSFLYQEFKKKHRTSIAESELTEHLEDYLEDIRNEEIEDNEAEKGYKSPNNYLTEWCNNQWLSRIYDKDEYIFKLTPDSDKAILLIVELEEKRDFIPTESRFATIFSLLKEIYNYSNTDAESRIEMLEEEKRKIQQEIDKIKQTGRVTILNSTELKERFNLASSLMRQLLADFSEIEQKFEFLAQEIYQDYLQDNISKGLILGKVISVHKTLDETEQGQSFQAFFKFLNSDLYQSDLDRFVENIYSLDELRELTKNDQTLKKIKRDLMTYADPILKLNQNITAKLSQILQEKNLREYRRINELFKDIESLASRVTDHPPIGSFFYLEGEPNLNFSIERPLHSLETSESSLIKTDFSTFSETEPSPDIFAEIYSYLEVDEEKLKEQIKSLLLEKEAITFQELTDYYPIQQGLAEIVAYLSIATESAQHSVNSIIIEGMVIEDIDAERCFQVTLPQIIFRR